jgi:hypothetical protein
MLLLSQVGWRLYMLEVELYCDEKELAILPSLNDISVYLCLES